MIVGLVLAIALWPGKADASLLHLKGGIASGQEYREILWLTGSPVLLTGSVRETITTGRDGSVTHRLTFTNFGNREHGITVARSLTFVSSKEERGKQRITNTRLTSFRETITVGENRYILEDYQLAHSAITDRQPVVAYQSANWTARKTYNVNRNAGRVVVETWGTSVGYQHNWGKTATHKIEGTLSFAGMAGQEDNRQETAWDASFQLSLSESRSRRLEYHLNIPAQISFPGGYIEVGQDTAMLEYSSNLPHLKNGLVIDSRRLQATGSQQLTGLPRQKRLPVPFLRDIQGHWAMEDILSLASLGAFPGIGTYFGPRLPMLRGDFAAALVTVAGLSLPQPPAPQRRGGRAAPEPEQTLFADVPLTDPLYRHFQAVFQAGLMQGTGPGLFSPRQALTRAQAVTVLVRALGLENTVSLAQGNSPFRDDAAIPLWARDAVLVAHRLGLVTGNEQGLLLPNQTLTRAEAAALLSRFIRYLQTEMKKEFRERILHFR
jgi:hypothetical protein